MGFAAFLRNRWLLWLGLIPTFFLLWYFPYINFPTRILTWIIGGVIATGALFYTWPYPNFRWALMIIMAALLLFLLWPSAGQPPPSDLRIAYCNALQSYTGTRYVWGGEGILGMDCSGLVRKGMEDALAWHGLKTFDPALLRSSISLYWHDTNARTIGEGYFGRTSQIMTCPSLNGLDYSPLQPGDLAVTAGGDHILAYLGNRTWIAADPVSGRVTRFTIPEVKNFYFSVPMKIVRWKILAD